MPRTSSARVRLVQSACKLLHGSSYAATSVEDLCAAAGVQKGSFYHFFATKQELALAALDEHWARTQNAILQPAFARDVPGLQRITRFFRSVAEHQRAPVVLGCPFGNLAVELATQDDAVRRRVAEVFDGYRGYFEGALRDADAAGQVPAGTAAASAEALLAYFQGVLLVARTRNDSHLIERLGDKALDLVGGGVNTA
jgi:TetR/AcrR family transcriptional regulator, transcriptional repressor for nem operon